MFFDYYGKQYDELPKLFANGYYSYINKLEDTSSLFTDEWSYKRGECRESIVCTNGETFQEGDKKSDYLFIDVSKGSTNRHILSLDYAFFPKTYKIHVKYRVREHKIFNNRLITRNLHGLVVINVKTGRSYCFGLRTGKGNLVKYERRFSECTYSLITGVSGGVSFDIFPIAETIVAWKKRLFPHLVMREFDCDARHSLSNLISFNRFPMKTFMENKNIAGYEVRKYVKSWENDPILGVINAFNLPNVLSIRRLIGDNLDSAVLIKQVYDVTKNIDYAVSVGKKWGGNHFSRGFLSKLCRKLGVKVACRKILNADLSVTRDAMLMFDSLRGLKVEVDLKGSMKEIHDELVRLQFKHKNENVLFEIHKDFETDLIFSAVDSEELFFVGKSLTICVYGYSTLVESGKCVIFLLKKNGIDTDVCIEVSGDMKRIVQAKARFNQRPAQEDRNIIIQWAFDKGLKIDTKDLVEVESICCAV